MWQSCPISSTKLLLRQDHKQIISIVRFFCNIHKGCLGELFFMTRMSDTLHFGRLLSKLLVNMAFS